MVVIIVRFERARAHTSTSAGIRAPLRLVAVVQLCLRAQARLELRLGVVVLRSLRDPVRLVPIEVGHRAVIPVVVGVASG